MHQVSTSLFQPAALGCEGVELELDFMKLHEFEPEYELMSQASNLTRSGSS